MEMGNVSNRQQPDHRTDNSRMSPTGFQCSEKFPHPGASFSWPHNKYIYKFSDNKRHTKLQIVHKKLKLKIITNKGQRPETWDRRKKSVE